MSDSTTPVVAHSPLPWRKAFSENQQWLVVNGLGDDGDVIARIPRFKDFIDQADAEFIVRACNAHDELIAALRAIKRRIHFIGMPQEPFRDDDAPDWRKEIALLEAAIAKADGK